MGGKVIFPLFIFIHFPFSPSSSVISHRSDLCFPHIREIIFEREKCLYLSCFQEVSNYSVNGFLLHFSIAWFVCYAFRKMCVVCGDPKKGFGMGPSFSFVPIPLYPPKGYRDTWLRCLISFCPIPLYPQNRFRAF